jgi:hypothetical protein
MVTHPNGIEGYPLFDAPSGAAINFEVRRRAAAFDRQSMISTVMVR